MLWRRRRRPAEGRLPVFLAPRPVPQRLAGYNPAPPVETGRVPTTPNSVTTPPPVTNPPIIFPPVIGPPPITVPPIIVPPVIIPPGEPPCDDDPETDIPDCSEPPVDPPPDPEEPPVDVPEPGTLILLLTGALMVWFYRRKRTA